MSDFLTTEIKAILIKMLPSPSCPKNADRADALTKGECLKIADYFEAQNQPKAAAHFRKEADKKLSRVENLKAANHFEALGRYSAAAYLREKR